MAQAQATVPPGAIYWQGRVYKEETMLSITWRRFCRHRPAVLGGAVILLIVLASILAPMLSPYDPLATNLAERLQPPSANYLFGTDELGRDLLTRLLYGGRISLSIGVLAVALAATIGTAVGAAAGFYGGPVDNLLMRFADAMLSFPILFLLILFTLILRSVDIPGLSGGGPVPIILVIGFLSWMTVSRLVRASFLSLKQKEFVEAARMAGARNPRIIVRHILPNAISPIIVAATLRVASAILTESGLSYLGFGVQPPTPTWGNMLKHAQAQMTYAPWTAIFPGLMIFIAVIAINYIGDGLRDALDPYRVE